MSAMHQIHTGNGHICISAPVKIFDENDVLSAKVYNFSPLNQLVINGKKKLP